MPWERPPNHHPRPRVGAKTRLGFTGTVYTVSGVSLDGRRVRLTRDSDGEACTVRRYRTCTGYLPKYRTQRGQCVTFYVDGAPCMMSGCDRPGVIGVHGGRQICSPCARQADGENAQIARAQRG